MLTGDEGEVLLALDAQVLQDHFELVIFADGVLLTLFVLLTFLLFAEGRQGEAGIALKQVSRFLEFLLEFFVTALKTDVH